MAGTILLADDSITIQKVVELTFASTDSEVVAVGSGRELLEKLPEVQPHVVLCDVVMPDMNGYDVCQQIKSDPATLHIPVVLLTGTFEPFDRERAVAAGCDSIVTKPFEAKELVGIVEELLERATAAEAAGVDDETPPQMQGEAGEVPQDGLDFTTTGFDKMVPPEEQPAEAPSEGLDLTGSFRDEYAEVPAAKPTDADTQPVTPVFGEEEQPAPEPAAEGPFAVRGDAPEASPAASETSTETAVEDEDDAGGETVVVSVREAESEPEVAAGEEQAVAESPEAPPEPPEESPGAEPAGAPAWTDEPAAAATEGEREPETTSPPATAEAEAEAATVVGPLSDGDVDRIARRVVELAAPQLERIAWEVIPEMAEMLVRKRIRELEAAVEEEN